MLLLICGYPNAGKTTYSQKFDNVIHLDDYKHPSKICKEVSTMTNVVVEGIYLTNKMRVQLLSAYQGKYKKCIFLDVPLSECIKRETRGRKSFVFENFAKSFEPPTLDEGWDEIVIIKNENEITHIKKE